MNGKRIPVASLLFILIAISFLISQVGAGQDQPASKPQAWDAGTRYPDWEAPSILEIVNECNKEHSFSVTKKDADFLDFLFTQPIRVPGHKSVTVPVRFHTDGMTPGIYSGLVTILCTDCTEVPPCMQDRKIVAPRIRILPRPAPGTSETTPTSPEKTSPPVAPPAKLGDNSSTKEKTPVTPPPETPPTKPGDNPSTQEKPPETPNRVELKGCCCNIDKLELRLKSHARPFEEHEELVWRRDQNGDPVQEKRKVKATFGHEFKVLITYRIKRITGPKEKPGNCVLEWLERSHNLPQPNLDAKAKVDEWNDIGKLMGAYDERYIYADGTTLGPWYNIWYDPKRKKPKKIECPFGPKTIELIDKPAILYETVRRTLEFHIILKSTCTEEPKDLWAKQVLDTEPSNKNSKFYISDDEGKTWTEAKIKLE